MIAEAAYSVAQPIQSRDYYTTEIDYNGGTNATYIGQATPGTATSAAAWQIKFITYDGNNNPTSITWANASSKFAFIWASRTSYSYS